MMAAGIQTDTSNEATLEDSEGRGMLRDSPLIVANVSECVPTATV